MSYRCVAASVAGFIQQLAVSCIAHGYFFYVTGVIPEGKDPVKTDHKIVARYRLDLSKWVRCRQKRAGLANVQYLRHERYFVIIATHGVHPFFEAEGKQIYDVRRRPILFRGYSIGCRPARNGGNHHASVRMERGLWLELKRDFEKLAARSSAEQLIRALRAIPFEPYAPVRDQLRGILRALNRRRKAAGLELLSADVLRLRRKPVRVFSGESDDSGFAQPAAK